MQRKLNRIVRAARSRESYPIISLVGIEDIYSHIREELIVFLKSTLENKELCSLLDRIITRPIVKKILMPISSGKTINSTSKDLIISLGMDVLPKELTKLATQCFSFWKKIYSGMEAFIEQVRLVGRVCSPLERPVLYSTPYFKTSQDSNIKRWNHAHLESSTR